MHWVQDQYHCYRIAFTGNIADANEFREIIDISIQRAALRKVEDNQVDTISKAADPGKFQDERKWPDWEPAFVKPLSYDWDPYNVCFPSCSYHSSDSTPIKSSYSVLVVDTLLRCTIYDAIMVILLMSSQVQVAEIATRSVLQDVPSARMFQSKKQHSTVTPSDLSKRWYIDSGQVTQMLKVTTQRLMCSAILPLAQ